MRILYQSDGFLLNTIGGVEIFSYHLLQGLRSRGHEAVVITSVIGDEPAGPSEYKGVPLRKLGFGAALARRDLAGMQRIHKEIAALVAEFQPDVLHLNDAQPSSFFFLRGGATGALPRALTLHSPIRPSGRDTLQMRLARDADRVVAVSHSQYEDALLTFDGMQEKLTTIPNALPLPSTLPAALPFEPPRLLYLGRLVVDKGVDTAIRAASILKQRGIAVRLTIAGNGPERKNLEALARECGIAESTQFTDWILPDQVPALINTATLVLMPSRWREPFGLVALQAAQIGRPVLASVMGGLREIVQHDRTGLLLPPDEDLAWADAIAALLRAPGKTAQLGHQARQQAQQRFDFPRFVDAYEETLAGAQVERSRGRFQGLQGKVAPCP